MRARIALIIEEELLARVDLIAGEKIKRSSVIVKAIREFIEREDAKVLNPVLSETVTSTRK